MSDQKPKIKLNLKLSGLKKSQDEQDQNAAATPQSATAATPKLFLKFGSTSAATPSTPKATPPPAAATDPKPSKSGRKPKPTAKKRTLDSAQADDDGDESDSEPLATKSKVSTSQPPIKKIKFTDGGTIKKNKKRETAESTPNPSGTASGPSIITFKPQKHKGKIPERPLGVGYDSEASDREKDPAIDEALILRMAPGEDCDFLRSSIANNTLGVSKDGSKDGNKDVSLRFVTHDGRRACLIIRKRRYAAVLVDLPCVIEAMKSWNKKEWYKSSDICQMLFVLGQVQSDEEAKTYDLKHAMTAGGPIGRGELDEKTWAWAHGLTPPMRWVRKRRFRKRISTKLVEEDEREVERLLKDDADAIGGFTYRHVDMDALEREQAEADYDDYDDADGDMEEDGYEMGHGNLSEIAAGNDDDDDDLEAHLEAEMLKQAHEGEDLAAAAPATSHIAGPTMNQTSAHFPPNATSPPLSASAAGTPSFDISATAGAAEAEDMATSPSDNNPNATTAAASAASASVSSDEDDSDEDDDDDDDDANNGSRPVNDDDESALEEAQDRQRQREEISDLEAAIAREEGRLKQTPNQILKQKIARTIQGLKADLELKMDGMGVGGGGGGKESGVGGGGGRDDDDGDGGGGGGDGDAG